MRRAVIAAAVLVALVAPARAQDDAVAYRVKQGDSLELIAAEFYGDRSLAGWIAAENKLTHGRTVHGGDRIKVPIAREVVTAKGDTFESLATTYLGDASRAPFLAEANAMSIEDSLATGTTIVIPLHVTHVAQGTESLASVAQSYLGDARQAEMLARYNGLDKTTLEKGETIVVANLHVRVRPSRLPALDADAKARRDAQHQAVADASEALPRAEAAWLQADFAGVKAALARVADEVDYLDTRSAVEIGLLLGRAHVAFGETDAAIAAFAQVLDRRPRYRLSPYADSPKVIAVWQKAGGHVEGE